MKHNFDYSTKWEILDKDGNIIQKGENKADPNTEGSLKISYLNQNKDTIEEHEQPMKSFTVGLLHELAKGYRIESRNDSYATGTGEVMVNLAGFDKLYTMIGESPSPTYVQQIRPIASPTVFSPNAFMNNSKASSTSAPVKLESLTESTNYIEAVMSVERMIDNVLTTENSIYEVCLYGCSGKMIARDVLNSPLTYQDLTWVKFTWTIRFLISNARVMTKNWVLNFLQNINYDENDNFEAFTDFVAWDFENSAEVYANGRNCISQTFTKYQNCMGESDDRTVGIVIGSSDNDVSYSDTHLGNQLFDINYGKSTTVSPIAEDDYITPIIQPTNGTAHIYYSRDFYNNTGSTVTINEAGVYAKTAKLNEGIDKAGSYLICHWLTGRIELPIECTLRIYWKPQITATAELYDIDELTENKILVLTDEIREKYPRLRNISMIEAVGVGQKWHEAHGYARNLTICEMSGWRLMTCHGQERYNNPSDEVFALIEAKEDLHNLAVAQGIVGDNFVPSNTNTYSYWSEAEWHDTGGSATAAWTAAVQSWGTEQRVSGCYKGSAAFYRRCVR